MEADQSADADSALSAERLKYVTEHFHQLQGLTFVAFGIVYLFPVTGVFWDRWPVSGWLAVPIGVALVGACVATFPYLPKYYRRRFGWIEPHSPDMTNKQLVFLLLVLLALLFFGRPIGRYADSILADVRSMIPAHPVTFSPALLWSFYLCMSFRRNPHQEDLYRMYFLASGALAWAFTALYPIWHPDAMHPALWKFLDDGWLGLSFIALGLYDHLTLVRLMPRRIDNLEDDNGGSDID